jgi:hypothetical protein
LLRKPMLAVLILSISLLASKGYINSVKASASLTILPTDSGYLNNSYFYYVVGEVQNTGDTAVTDVYINATFYDSTGVKLAEISQPTKLYTILPGRISPFDITLLSVTVSSRVANYTLHVAKYSPTQNGQVGLTVASNSSSLDSSGFHIEGTIKNVGTQNTTYVEVIATLYNATGHAIATVVDYSDPGSLDINQTAQFNTLLNSSVANKVDHYALEAESYDSQFIQDYESIPEFQPLPFIFTLLILTTTIILTLKHPRKTMRNAQQQSAKKQAAQTKLPSEDLQ